ncbi:hypothetical protein N0V93_006203 [Gnomoniopsis smithogilvyi]|uniref:Zn(2)-C6 fungal-type domain-containing protein n=1 Tax=Gnomoniopsis smithogilvyi TaxID=1191159 RepID=A0A9W9CUA1_9PEZI|nr:hypothetical protein N0V93_006203 [Gnomoniopsis smithogilvyi]
MSRSNEYSLGGREHPEKYHSRRLSGHRLPHDGFSGSSSSSTSNRDYQSDIRTRQHPPPQQQEISYPRLQQSSPTTGETSPTKDGLGPKIWTGTHFLPRFVRAAEVPGEGMCYFYDDGSHCKTTIDGEVVNAHWGVTKAGKPRKRLAIACITCREKKIKCDPDYPRCVQCEKFGRVCKFKNAPRGGGHHNTSPTSESGEQMESTQRRVQPYEHSQRGRHSPSVSPRTTVPSLTLAGPAKRAKYEPSYPGAGGREHNETPAWQQPQPSYGLAGQLPLPRLHDDMFRQQRWRNDPYSPDARHQEIPRRTDGARV